MDVEFAIPQTRRRDGHLTTPLFAEHDRFAARRIGLSTHGGRHTDIFHQPYPLPYGLGPHLFIGPANLGGPVWGVVEALGFNSHRKRANHLARTNAVKRRPVVAFAVHDTSGERIAADEPLSLFLGQVFGFEI